MSAQAIDVIRANGSACMMTGRRRRNWPTPRPTSPALSRWASIPPAASPRILVSIQFDHLGIDYLDRRDATHQRRDPGRRQARGEAAARSPDKLLFIVVGQPENLNGRGARYSCRGSSGSCREWITGRDIDGCLADAVGQRGLDHDALDAMLARTAPALEKLKRLARRRQPAAAALARRGKRRYRAAAPRPEEFPRRRRASKFRDVIILGTGGSSLGGQTLYALADRARAAAAPFPRQYRSGDVRGAVRRASIRRAPASSRSRNRAAPPRRCRNSRSASTGCAPSSIPMRSAAHTIAITEPRDNPLRLLATRLKTALLDHDPGIGGRYSVLSNVGLLPALLAGSRCRGAARRCGRDAGCGAQRRPRRARARRRSARRSASACPSSTASAPP